MEATAPGYGLLGLSQRLPPANLEAEQALLGAILANNRAFERVAEFLAPHHFADPVHGRIYEAMSLAINAGKIADAVTLRPALENSGVLSDVGGIGYLAQLLSAMVGIINAGDYGRVIHDAWMRRELIDACEMTVNRCFAPGSLSGPATMEELDAALTRIGDGAGEVKPMVSAGEAVEQAVDLAATASARAGPLAGITTGYASLDRMTSGLLPGQMYLIGARPGMGKSGLALGIGARVASSVNPETQKNYNVLCWSGEMAGNQLGARLAASHTGLDVLSVFRGKGWQAPEDVEPGAKRGHRPLTQKEWDNLVRAQRAARNIPLYIDDRPGISVSALRARARRMKRGKGLDLVIVDYVGLMRPSEAASREKLYERMTEISSGLALLAAELHVPMLVMAQLNRDVEKRENKMPQLSDLRDSGGLEQDAYCVMFLYRPYYYLMQAGEPVRRDKEAVENYENRCDVYRQQLKSTKNLALLNIAKQRQGPTGPCRLKFDEETIWFRDESEDDNSAAWGADLLGEA